MRSKRRVLEAEGLLSAHELAERVVGLRRSWRATATSGLPSGSSTAATGTPRSLHLICVVRMRVDERIHLYVARRTAEGKSKQEILRCLKRYIACKVYRVPVSAVLPSPNG